MKRVEPRRGDRRSVAPPGLQHVWDGATYQGSRCAPPLATLGRPSGAAITSTLAAGLQGLSPLATIGRPSGAPSPLPALVEPRLPRISVARQVLAGDLDQRVVGPAADRHIPVRLEDCD